jgi:ABC-type bacteriocin/lantibiotic exporter with double-glycine peptidase domain
MANYLPVPYYKQNKVGYCLAACAQMVLAFQGVSRSQDNLANQLQIKPSLGIPTRNIQLLASRDISVVYGEGVITDLQKWLVAGKPVITFVQAGEFSHWQGEYFQHAVVVIGITDQIVWLLDPDKDETPIAVSEDEFMLAWLGMDYLYAVISVGK